MPRLPHLLPAVLLALSACASAPGPPYQDFAVRPSVDSTLTVRLRSAAEAAGWVPAPALAPGVVSTVAQRIGGTRTTAALDLVPINAGPAGGASARYVRVVVRAERRSVLGGRSKVYALDGRLRERVLGPITAALAARGFAAVGAPRERDDDLADE